ncbi:adenosine deaminase [Caulobacter sp. AP07]|uniref:AlkA N-terminal domain-containing protein n=1 Tax=Caulobacter sp. AP07 TaxID=1144304 RepID=UPI0002721AEF|nr:AlkA N-terminal domain-containing protein [Caulobacter sp. AP07]EJL34507.1 adenosine deaminase [Caulobacter sp. AP07]
MDLDPDACYRAIQTRDARFDGRLFVAVRTTGIYCRPVCPARTPLRQNVTFHATAASAQEAGYRACLRCRPETSPQLGAWNGASNTVSRALALIEAGALDANQDGGDVESLAERVGVGGRQLRRLFLQHLGATPVGVAQTRRVLLAKQLIHETDLPMGEVALAAGFGSVRRFNETFQQLYDRPPAALRRRKAISAPANDAIVLTLRYRPPYDWDGMLAFLAMRAIPGVEVVRDGVYRRAIALDGAAGTIAVRPIGDDRLSVAVRFPRPSALPRILARVRGVFDLSADPVGIGEVLSRDPDLAAMVAARPGLRVPGAWDGFELAVRAILGQQITVVAARKLAGDLVAVHGEPLAAPWAEPGLTHTFPAAARLADADLTGMKMPGARIRCLSAMARAIADDPNLLSPNAGLDDMVKRLRALPGVGEWTAQYIAMRQLREPDAFPAADVALMRALTDADGVRPTAEQLLARAEAWRPWRAYAALHLWASLADEGAPPVRRTARAA